MKKIQLLVLATSFSSFIFAQNYLSHSVFQSQAELKQIENLENFGLVPEPVSVDYTNYNINSTLRTTVLPAIFDLRTTGGITSVKNQGSCGSCWLFPSMGAVESRWKRLGYGDLDLSEDNLKHCHNYNYLPCAGGNRLMATAYFTRGKGPVLESQDPYSASSATGCPVGLMPTASITEAWFLPNKGITDIKQAIFNYGAVYNTFFWNSRYYNSSRRIYCQTRDTSASNNHAVLLVGWNDTITTPLGKGVWIVKNSWGSTWGDAGFFYISFHDKEAAQDPTIWVNRSNFNSKQIVHGYDDLGWTASMGGAKTCYGVVKFTASTNQILKQIATYAVSPNTTISAEIYSTFSGTTFSGLIGTVPAKTFQYAGYYTLDVASAINITSGSNFYIKYKVSNATSSYPLAVESKITGYSTNAVIETGKCWTSTNGTSWTTIGATSASKYDLSFKAISEASCDFLKSVSTPSLSNLCSGQTTTFTASSSVAGTTFQWQVSTDNGLSWVNVINGTKYSGATTSSLKVIGVTLSFDKYLYRCNVMSACNSIYSNISTLRVTSTPVVILHPVNTTVALNTAAILDVQVSNPSNCLYQWQINTSGTTWTNLVNNTNIAGATTNELYVNATSSYINKKYRCRLKSSCTSTYSYSNPALLSILTSSTASGSGTSKLSETTEPTINFEENIILYPNPANELININYSILNNTKVEITLYDMLGQIVVKLVNNELEAGEYTTDFNTSNLNNGTYLVIFTTSEEQGKQINVHKRLVVNH